MNVDLVYIAFAAAGLALFMAVRPAVAVFAVFLGGWLILPVGHYPAGSADAVFPYWITGLAVPSDMLLTKAWIAPAVALSGSLAFDRAAWRRLRPRGLDAPMLLWCLWPLLQAPLVAEARPYPGLASLYLFGSWGLPWIIGRLYLASFEGRRLFARALAWSVAACLPIGLIEGALGPVLYGWLFEPHPFRHDGAERYVGFRPLGFFENGNQYGLWMSLSALSAIWLAASESGPGYRGRRALAWLGAGLALAAQSVGGLLMLGFGAAFLWICRWVRPRALVAAGTAMLVMGGAVYVSGVVPVTQIGKGTVIGQRAIEAFRAVGRGSFAWRISQDQKLLGAAMARPVSGSGAWDWWRSKDIRPWSLSMLLLGQFGLIGLCLAFGSLLAPAVRSGWQAPRESGWRPVALPSMLAALVALAVADALLNSFFFFPAITAAGGLAAGDEAD